MSARSDFISGLAIFACTAVFYSAALNIEEDPFGVGMEPYVFPLVICYLLGGVTLVLLGRSVVSALREGLFEGGGEELRLFICWVLPMAAIAFAYLGLVNLFQYLLPTILALSASLALFGNRGVKWLVVIPVISGLVYYVIFFGVFRLLEPSGLLLEYDNYYLFGAMRKLIGV